MLPKIGTCCCIVSCRLLCMLTGDLLLRLQIRFQVDVGTVVPSQIDGGQHSLQLIQAADNAAW